MIDIFDDVSTVTMGIISIYALLWTIPGVIISIVISMGSYQHIIFLDKQLAKDLDKLYDSNGQMRNPLFTTIANRYHKYCILYPFIRDRATTGSVKFKVFMWLNSLGFWCWIIGLVFMLFS
ncbi:hypothetical protein VA7868_00397 [Vibrio aerogenes CECT 7868]|uniref:Uncharacterized protein n=1 Tax=Vibrio aerogenes CECT 7868 TaxID=1216006 RepID=A0A1M5VI01_9VIBR|nr:hypothetical protein VA7868_00397 [Vibrio aerogenes CECT 7868]